MLQITNFKINYEKNPIGVDQPLQFGWVIEADGRNITQKSYHLQMDREQDFQNPVFDSGSVDSENSAHVFAEGFLPLSCTQYYVRVKVRDNRGEESPWSDTAFFVTGILAIHLWKGEFVSAEKGSDAENSKSTYIRKEFTITKPVKEAFACTTALGLYLLYVNGQKVGEDQLTPGWTSYHKHLVYQTYEITSLVSEGRNTLGALLGAGWYKGKMGFDGYRNNYGKQTALLYQLLVRYEDGSEEVFVSDESCKGAEGPVVFAEIYDGEIYDANLENNGWCENGFDDTGWEHCQVVPFDKKALTAQGNCRVREIEPLPVKRMFTTPEGDLVLDFGQNLTGWIHFTVKGKKGDKVQLVCFEVLDAKGNVYLDNLREAKQTVTYICKDEKPVEFHPHFTFQGFQYAKIAAYPGEAKPENFTAYAVHSDMEQTGFFACSHEDLNQLQHNILWGLKGNFVDIPTDCPQRNERMGWTGDAQIFCRTATYLMNTYPFFKKWLRDVKEDQTPEGGVPHVVPDIISDKPKENWLVGQGSHSAAAWADVAVINPWTLYLTFGDQEILRTHYGSMKAWIDFMKNHSKNGIWNYQLQFGDWVALDAEEGSYFGATPNDLTCTAYYAYSTGLFAKIARVLGREEDGAKYEALYDEIVESFQEHFFDQDGNMTAQTQTAHIIALHFQLVPEAYQEKTIQGLLRLLEKENGHLVTGFVGTPYFCHALSSYGHTKEAYELLLKEDFPSWLYQVKMGATTVWEHWDGLKPDGTMWSPDMNSFNHYAYGAIGEWMYRVAAGIEIDERQPGYKHSIIYPHIGGSLDWVRGAYRSVYGEVVSHWKVDEGRIILEVRIPHNTTADIILDRASAVLEADGLVFSKAGDNMKGKAGSGEYRIVYRM